MGRLRVLISGAVLFLAFTGSSASAGIIVKTRTPVVTQLFWIVRDEDRNRLMRLNPGTTVRAVVERFRLFPINNRPLPTKANVAYSVYLRCQGAMRTEGIPVDGGQSHVYVDC